MRLKQCLIIVAILIFSFSFLVATQSDSQAKSLNITFNKPGPAVHRGSMATAEFMAREVEKRTNGRVKITIYPGSTLASPPETFDATIKGICDFGESLVSFISGRFPVSEACDLPLGYPSSWVQGHVFTDFYNKFKPKEWDDVVPIYFAGPPPAVIGTVKKPVRRLEDLKGLTLRAHSGAARLVKALGAVPRVMPINEVYEALAKGVVDGCLVALEAFKPFRFIEKIKFVTDIRFVAYGSLVFHVMNKDTWAKISPGDQKIIREVAVEATDHRGKIWDEEDEKGMKGFISTPGRTFITLPPAEVEKFKAAAQVVVDEWVKKKTGQGYPAADYVKYLRERIAYWSARQP